MEKETKVLTSHWLYVGLKYQARLLILHKHTSRKADLNGILDCCSIVFEITRDELLGRCRKQEFAIARHAFMKLSKDITEETYGAIGAFLGERDHSTALNSARKANDLIETYSPFRDKFEMCKRLLIKAETDKETYKLKKLSERIQLIKKFKIDENEFSIENETNETSIRSKRSETA